MDRGSIYVAIFSLRDMADLCPKGIDLDMKPSAPSSPPTLPPYPGLQTEQTESQGTHPGRVVLVSVKAQTEIQTAHLEFQTTPRASPATYSVSEQRIRCSVTWVATLSIIVATALLTLEALKIING